MTTQEKAEAIIKKIVEICNTNQQITFEGDMGENTLTIAMSGRGHTHVGISGDEPENFDILVNGLYNTLHGGPGLSWA